MKIEKLILQNVGAYRNRNIFDLKADRPIILIGGLNGRGKTTFLEAVLLALYGKHSGDILHGKRRFEEYLRNISNISGDSSQCYVELHFTVKERETTYYQIKRSWNPARVHLKLSTTVKKNGIYDVALSENWDMFVEQILPRGIAPFFFFDGEKIAELAAADDDEHLRVSVMSLLGIDVIEQLIADLHIVLRRQQKKLEDGSYTKELQENSEQTDKAKEAYAEKFEIIKRKKEERDSADERLFQLEEEYSVRGGYYEEKKYRYQEEKKRLLDVRSEYRNQLLELASANMPLGMVSGLITDIRKNSETETEQYELQVFLKQFQALYRDYFGSDHSDDKIDGFISFVQDKVKNDNVNYVLDKDTREKLAALDQVLEQEREQAKQTIARIRQVNKKIGEIDNYLAIQTDDNKLAEIMDEIAKTEKERDLMQEALQKEEAECEELRQRIDILEKNRRQILKKAADEADMAEDNLRVMTYAQKQIDIMQIYKRQLQEMKTSRLAEQMTICFQKLIAKGGLIERVEIDPETLVFSYYNRENKRIDKILLSSGEKQLLVIAMLWALGICSKTKLPLIIDTPLARLDSFHRASLIKNYFPEASEQVIILSTDQEIRARDYQMLKPYIGKEFTLVYDEETMSSAVRPGYFERSAG